MIRTLFEDRMLRNELGGYREYALDVRQRLVPGVWWAGRSPLSILIADYARANPWREAVMYGRLRPSGTTDAKGFPNWSSTITRFDGEIRDGERLRLHVPETDRTFTPRVSGLVPNQRMTWTGGPAPIFSGVRTFVLRPRADGSTDFAMNERFSGVMLR